MIRTRLDERGNRVAVIRTSDRQLFKRCRRKWSLQSGLRMNLDTLDRPSYFWLGSGGHFALEDYHGYNVYGHPVEAFRAYVRAQKLWAAKSKQRLPSDLDELVSLGEGILDNYLLWLRNREPLQTLWVDGEPQVEIRCTVDLTPYINADLLELAEVDKVVYQGTLDRVVVVDGELWVQDWKFYKTLNNSPYLDFDQQMSSYVWLANTIYPQGVVGAILHQFRKALPNAPKILGSGKLSVAGNQGTTHTLYRDAIQEIYGEVNKAPRPVMDCLNDLASRENADRDDFIRRDRTRRTPEQQQAEGTRILMEIEDMLNPDLPLYTNHTRDCSWDCGFQEICLMIDRNDHWQAALEESSVSRDAETDDWREYLPEAA